MKRRGSWKYIAGIALHTVSHAAKSGLDIEFAVVGVEAWKPGADDGAALGKGKRDAI